MKKKTAAFLSLIFLVFGTGTANALAHEYYHGLHHLSEPFVILLLGIGLIWTAGVCRKNLQ
jgi:hypothetical protein